MPENFANFRLFRLFRLFRHCTSFGFWLCFIIEIFNVFLLVGCDGSSPTSSSNSDKNAIDKEIAKLVEELRAENPAARLNAALTLTGLAELKGQLEANKPALLSAVEPLISLLKDADAPVRSAAAAALGEIADKGAVEPLITALKDDEAEVRFNSVYALGVFKDKRAVKPLIDLLKVEADAYIRTATAEALGKLEDKRAVESLILSLKDVDKAVRTASAEALGKIGSQKAISSLRRLAAEDPDEGVRHAAKKSLDKLRC